MPQEAVTFEIGGKEMPVYKLMDAVTEFWSQVEPAKIRVIKKGGVTAGEHELELKLMLRGDIEDIDAVIKTIHKNVYNKV